MKNNAGLTLLELLVSSVLVGVMMLGIVGFNFAIRRFQETTDKGGILAMKSTAALNHIRQNAAQAIGDASNPGIVLDDTDNPPYFSFRVDRDPATGNANNTPGTYSDDSWIIYTDHSVAGQLGFCTQSAATGAVPQTGAGDECEEPTLIFLNNIANISYNFNQSPLTFEISITARDDPGAAVNPIDNPEHTVSTRIRPNTHSW